MGRVGFSIGFGGSPSNETTSDISKLPNTLSSIQSGELLTQFGDGDSKQVYSMRGDTNASSLNNSAEPESIEVAMRGDIETLKLEAKSKQAEIDRLKAKLEQLINQSEAEGSEEVIISLKNQIKDLVEQLALERKESETTYDKQSATIQLLQTELKRQKEITQRIMQKLGMLTTEN